VRREEIRNPKSEILNKSKISNPKSEIINRLVLILALLSLLLLLPAAAEAATLALASPGDTSFRPGLTDATAATGETFILELWADCTDTNVNGVEATIVFDGTKLLLLDSSLVTDSFPSESEGINSREDRSVFGDVLYNTGLSAGTGADTARYAALTSTDSTRAKARVVSFTFQVKPAAPAGLTAITFGSTANETTALTAADSAATNVLTATDTGLIMITVPPPPPSTSRMIAETVVIAYAYRDGTTTNRRIILHNPTDTPVDLKQYWLARFTGAANWNAPTQKKLFGSLTPYASTDSTIQPGQFLLIGGDSTNVPQADFLMGTDLAFADNGGIGLFPFDPSTVTAAEAQDSRVDALGWGSVTNAREGLAFPSTIQTTDRPLRKPANTHVGAFIDRQDNLDDFHALGSNPVTLAAASDTGLPRFHVTAPMYAPVGTPFDLHCTLVVQTASGMKTDSVVTVYSSATHTESAAWANLSIANGTLSRETSGLFSSGVCSRTITINSATADTVTITVRDGAAWGTVTILVVPVVPNAPTPLAPANGAETDVPRPVFSWRHNDTDGNPQNRYHLQIADSSSFTNVIYQETVVIAETTITIIGLLPTGGVDTLYWQVRTATTGDSFSAFSAGDSFFIAKLRPPETPVLVAPADAHETSVKAIRFSWTHVDSDGSPQAGFNIQFSQNPDFSTLWRSDTRTSANEYYDTTFPGFSGDTTLYWRVRTTDLVGYGPFSDSRSFTLKDTTPIIRIVQVGMRFTSAGGQDSDYVQFLVVDDRNDSNGVDLNGWKLFINATARETFGALIVRTGDLIVLSWTADATIPDSAAAGADSVAWIYTTNVADGDGGISHTTSRAIWLADSSADTRDAVVFTADGNLTVATGNAVNALHASGHWDTNVAAGAVDVSGISVNTFRGIARETPAVDGNTKADWRVDTLTKGAFPLHHFDVSVDSDRPVSGETFLMTIRPRDWRNSPIPYFRGGVILEASGGGTISPAGAVLTGNAVETVVLISVLGVTETVTLRARAITGFGEARGETEVFIETGPLARFILSAQDANLLVASKTIRRNQPFDLTIRATDLGGNKVPTYAGTATLSANRGTFTPSSIAFDAAWNGETTIAVILDGDSAIGEATILAQDGSATGTTTVVPLKDNRLVINEVLVADGTATNDRDEWVEIHNRSRDAVDLTGWHITNYRTSTLIIDTPLPSISLPSGGFFVIHTSEPGADYSDTRGDTPVRHYFPFATHENRLPATTATRLGLYAPAMRDSSTIASFLAWQNGNANTTNEDSDAVDAGLWIDNSTFNHGSSAANLVGRTIQRIIDGADTRLTRDDWKILAQTETFVFTDGYANNSFESDLTGITFALASSSGGQDTALAGDTIAVTLTATGGGDPARRGVTTVLIRSLTDATGIVLTLVETTPNSRIFTGQFTIGDTPSRDGIMRLGVLTPDSVTIRWVKGGTETTLAVVQGPLDHFKLTAPARTKAGMRFDLTVSARNSSDGKKTDYTGTVSLSVDMGGSISPASIAIAGADLGETTFFATIAGVAAGNTVTITAADVQAGTTTILIVTTPDLVINEIHPTRDDDAIDWNGDGGWTDRDEFIEIFNRGQDTVSMAGWRLGTRNATNGGIELAGEIPPRGYLVVHRYAISPFERFRFFAANGSQTAFVNAPGTDPWAPLPAANVRLRNHMRMLLKDTNATVVDDVDLDTNAINNDSSTARIWDGAETWHVTVRPTPGDTPAPSPWNDSSPNMRFRVDLPDFVEPNDSFRLTVTAVDAAGETVTGFNGTVSIETSGSGPTLSISSLALAAGTGGETVLFTGGVGVASLRAIFETNSVGIDTIAVAGAVIDAINIASDTPVRLSVPVSFDTGPGGDTVWFAAETQTVTITVLFTALTRDSITASAAFDSPLQSDNVDSYQAVFHIRPEHADAGDTEVTITSFDATGLSDSLLIRFRPDTVAPMPGALTTPAVDHDTTITSIVFSWLAAVDSHSGVAGYRLQVDTSGAFTSFVGDSATTALSETMTLPANETYFWRILALDNVGNSAVSESRSLIIDTAPPAPGALLFPNTYYDTYATTIIFSWETAMDSTSGVAGYRLLIDTANLFTSLVADSPTSLFLSETVTLTANDTYYWCVLVTDSAGNTETSAPARRLRIDTELPVPGILELPVANHDTNATTIVFSWSMATDSFTGVAGYRLQVDTANAFTSLVADSSTGLLLSETITLPANDTYYWRVLVTDSAGNTETYTPASHRLRIDTEPPVPGVLELPPADHDTNVTTIVFSWSVGSDTLTAVAGYRLQVATDTPFSALYADSWTALPSETVTLPGNDTYYWRVLATDSAGNTETYTPAFHRLLIDTVPPTILEVTIVSSVPTHFSDGGGIDTASSTGDTVHFNNGGAGAGQTCTVTVTTTGGAIAIVFPAHFGKTGVTETETPFLAAYTLTEGYGDTTMVLTARDSAGNEDSVTIHWVRDTAPPPVVGLLMPMNGQTIGDTTPTLTWNAAADTGAGTRGYVVQISDSSGFTTITESSFVTATEYTSTGLADSTWYWRVIPYDTVANVDTDAATIWNFIIDPNFPVITAITIVSSVDTRFFADSPVTPGMAADTVWYNPSGLAQTCTITVFVQDTNESYVTGSAAFEVIQALDTGPNKDSYILVYLIPADSPSELIAIEVTDEAGFMCTALVRFAADTTPPTVVTLAAPVDRLETNAATFLFSWSAAQDTGSGLARYRLQADTDPGFGALLHDSATTETSGQLTLLANDTWYWRVIAEDRVDNSAMSESWTLFIDTTPPVPGALIAPAHLLETNAVTLFFSWGAAFDTHTGVTSYRIQADTDPAFNAPYRDSATTETSGQLTLPANDTWHWRIAVTDSAGNVAYSESWSVIIDTAPPTASSLTAPDTTYDTNVTTITFTWIAATDALSGVASYRLQVDTSGAFGAGALVEDSSTPLTSGSLTLPANDTYWWRVVAYDDAGNTVAYTPARRLRIDTALPDSPGLFTYNGDSAVTPITLRWVASTDSLTGLAYYVIQIDTSGAFGAGAIIESAVIMPAETSHVMTTMVVDTYWWRVLAYDSAGNVAVSNPAADSFRLIMGDTTPPDTFNLTSPANLTETNAVAITLRWQDAADSSPPVTYRVQVDSTGLFTAFDTEVSGIADTFITVTLPANETYHWRVIAADAAGCTRISTDTWRFVIDTAPPFGSTLDAPADRAETNATTITFTWTMASDSLTGMAGYRLEFDTAPTFSAPRDSIVTTALTETRALAANDTWYWRVVMIDSVGNTAPTESRTLFIDTTPPVPGALIAPAHLLETNAVTLLFSWVAAFDTHTGVAGYRLQADTDPGFNAPYRDSATTETSGQLTLPANDTWHWRIAVTDSAGNVAYSESWSLVVDTAPPTAGALTAPDTTYDTNVTTIVFSWSAAADSLTGVAGYHLQVDTSGAFTMLIGDSATTTLTETLTLPANDTYWWRVLVTDSAGNTETYLPIRRLRIDTAPPDSPILATRNGDTMIQPDSLVWSASTDSLTGLAYYRIQIDTAGTFSSNIVDSIHPAGETSHILSGFAAETYYWRVLAYDSVGNVAISNPTRDSFRLISGDTRPPDSFHLTSPTDRACTNISTVTLRWQDAADSSPPVTYRVQVDSTGLWNGFDTQSAGLTETFLVVTLPVNETYSWRVIAHDAMDNTETSIETWRLIIDTAPPTAPVLFAHGGDSIEIPATLRWAAAIDTGAGLAGYIIQLDTAGTFVATHETGLTYGADTDYLTSSLTPGTWYWRVIAVDSAGNTAVAAVDSFLAKTADSTPPSAFSLTAPTNNTLTGSAAITFRWSNSIDATSPPVTYRLQVDTSAAFTSPAIDTSWISETQTTVILPKSDTWYWRVFARDNALNPNLRQSSETWVVTIDSEPPSSPILAAFQGATKVTPLRLLWTAPSDSISGVARILFRLGNAQPFAEPYTESTYLAPTETTRWTTVLPAGTYYWTLTAYDTLGNAAISSPAVDSFVVVADTTAPVAPPVVAPTLTNDSSSSCTVPIYIVDDAAVETVFVNLTVLGGGESTAAVPNSPPLSTDSLWVVTLPVDSTVSEGTYNLVVTFIDVTGNTGTTTITITIEDNSPSFAEVVESPLATIRAGGDFLSIISTYGDSYARIEYQYREAGVGAWKTCTPATGSANPDMTPPFWGFHWDISNQAEFLDGRTYEIRARATTTGGVTDPSPSHMRVIIDRTDSTHYERRNAAGLVEAHRKISPDTLTHLSIVDPIPGLSATTLIMPAGSVAETVWVRVTLMETSPAGIAIPTGFVSDSTGIFRRFEVVGTSGRARFLKPLTITLPYNDADTATDRVGQTSINEADLAIYYYDEARQAWLKPGASTVNGGRNTVTTTTEHFTIFAVLAPAAAAANLSSVIIYPNPWIPNDGNSRTGIPYDGTPNSGIIFENLPEQATVEIYSIAGKLVARMQKNDAFGRYNWDGRSDDNLDVASGVYLLVIRSGTGERIVKKVMIVR
jgi:hypothetical protein